VETLPEGTEMAFGSRVYRFIQASRDCLRSLQQFIFMQFVKPWSMISVAVVMLDENYASCMVDTSVYRVT
jgi:hypothetical protein